MRDDEKMISFSLHWGWGKDILRNDLDKVRC